MSFKLLCIFILWCGSTLSTLPWCNSFPQYSFVPHSTKLMLHIDVKKEDNASLSGSQQKNTALFLLWMFYSSKILWGSLLLENIVKQKNRTGEKSSFLLVGLDVDEPSWVHFTWPRKGKNLTGISDVYREGSHIFHHLILAQIMQWIMRSHGGKILLT
jgi:hypothetical protein